MKLIADEGVDKPIVDHLRVLGYKEFILRKNPLVLQIVKF